MKKTGFVFLAFATLALSACMNNKSGTTKAEVTKDTLTYTIKDIKQKETPCKSPADTGCKIALIYYQLFKNQSLLNHEIKTTLLGLKLPWNKKFDSDTVSDEFMSERGEYYYKFRHTSKSPIAIKIYSRVLRQDTNLIVLQIDGHNFSGGADSLIHFINWNTKINKSISLDDVFNPGYKEKLTTIAEKLFRKEENLKDTSSLARDYFFKDAKFALNNNFLLTPTGIRFLYNPKEIKPVEAGTTDLYIPYAQIKTLLKPNTVLAQYIQH